MFHKLMTLFSIFTCSAIQLHGAYNLKEFERYMINSADQYHELLQNSIQIYNIKRAYGLEKLDKQCTKSYKNKFKVAS